MLLRKWQSVRPTLSTRNIRVILLSSADEWEEVEEMIVDESSNMATAPAALPAVVTEAGMIFLNLSWRHLS